MGQDIALIFITVLTGFLVYRVDKVLTLVVQFNTTLVGLDGKSGLVSAVDGLRQSRGEHADQLQRLLANSETQRGEIEFLRKLILEGFRGATPTLKS